VTNASNANLSVADVVAITRRIYSQAKGIVRAKQAIRARICPFHILAGYVPTGGTVLDVGCGNGLWILLLAQLGRLRGAVGFDTNAKTIAVAQQAANQFTNSNIVRFEYRDANDEWPSGQFDMVSLIDVLHHVPPQHQINVLKAASECVAEGGLLLFKDIGTRPLWRAWANRMHDLLFAGEWVNYRDVDDVILWAEDEGLHVEDRGAVDMYWYRHEWCILRRLKR